MIYEAWEICELITNFAYEGNGKKKKGENEEKIIRGRDDSETLACNALVCPYGECVRVTSG